MSSVMRPDDDETPETQSKLQDVFLEAFIEKGSLKRAADRTNGAVTTYRHYRWLATDPTYALKWRMSQEILADQLEAEAYRRAVQGTERPVYQGGEWVGDVTEYSDNLLMFLLKGMRPDKYREKVTIINEQAVDAEIARLEAELSRRGVVIDIKPAGEVESGSATQEG